MPRNYSEIFGNSACFVLLLDNSHKQIKNAYFCYIVGSSVNLCGESSFVFPSIAVLRPLFGLGCHAHLGLFGVYEHF